MIYYSTSKSSTPVSMKRATLEGLAPDGGLYVPSELPALSAKEIANLEGASFSDIGFAIAKKFVDGEVPPAELQEIVGDACDFPTPLVRLDEDTFVEELFHGPTLAFKDYGARFLARMTGWFAAEDNRMITVLVATSGDTGSAVAYGFRGIPNTRVVLLYPSGKVSRLQEQQLTTAGGNVHALEVKGDFDDCQRLVKEAFVDPTLKSRLTLTSANSINISRLVPQSFYYASAALKFREEGLPEPVFSVPSGNYGNLTAGVLAKRMGFPIGGFIAASNANDSVTRYLEEGRYEPRPTRRTLSTAMDVGNPSNFARLLHIYGGDHDAMARDIEGTSVTDEETLQTIRLAHERFGYVMDPHTAVAYRALLDMRRDGKHSGRPGVVLSTAHPSKFLESVEETLKIEVEVPERLGRLLEHEKHSTVIEPRYGDLAGFLNGLDN